MSLFRASYQDKINTEIDINEQETPYGKFRRESVTMEFPDGEMKKRPLNVRSHTRNDSSCLVHDLLEVNKLHETALSSYASEVNLPKLENYRGNGKMIANTKPTPPPASNEPLSKVALSQLVTSVRDLSQSLSKSAFLLVLYACFQSFSANTNSP